MLDSEIEAAYQSAHRASIQMRELLAMQQELVVALDQIPPGESTAILDQQLAEARGAWLNVSEEYTAAVSRYTAAVDRAREERLSENGS